MPVVVFAISGHGFGHASRQTQIIRALRRRRPDAAIHIRTSAPRWLFERALDFPFAFERVEVDTGVVQVDSLEVDVEASIVRAAAFHAKLDERIDAEARALTTAGAELVVGDIPPLAFAAAAHAGIPAMAVGNFTWDWIWRPASSRRCTTPTPALPRPGDCPCTAVSAPSRRSSTYRS